MRTRCRNILPHSLFGSQKHLGDISPGKTVLRSIMKGPTDSLDSPSAVFQATNARHCVQQQVNPIREFSDNEPFHYTDRESQHLTRMYSVHCSSIPYSTVHVYGILYPMYRLRPPVGGETRVLRARNRRLGGERGTVEFQLRLAEIRFLSVAGVQCRSSPVHSTSFSTTHRSPLGCIQLELHLCDTRCLLPLVACASCARD